MRRCAVEPTCLNDELEGEDEEEIVKDGRRFCFGRSGLVVLLCITENLRGKAVLHDLGAQRSLDRGFPEGILERKKS